MSTGEAAIAVAQKTMPDLVLMDIMLAGEIDGIQAAAEIRRRFDVPVVFLTAYADEKTLTRAKLSEPFGYLMKPFEDIELRTTIEIALYKHAMGKKLQESELLFRRLFEGAGDAIFILEAEGDHSGRIKDVNQAAEKLHGYSIGELHGKNITDLDAPAAAAEAPGLMERMLRGEWIKTELDHRRKDGTLFPVEVSAGLIEMGDYKYVLAFDRDSTARKQAEKTLRQTMELQSAVNDILRLSLSGARIKDVLRQSLDVILSVPSLSFESQGCIFLANQKERVLRLTAWKGGHEGILKECGLLPYGTCLCGKAAELKQLIFTSGIDERHENAYAGMSPHGHYCVPVLHGDELLGVFTIYVKPGHQRLRSEENFLKAVADTLAGVLIRKQAADAIEESESKFRALFNLSNDGIFIIDDRGKFIDVNQTAHERLGYTKEEMLALDIRQLDPPEFAARVHERFAAIQKYGHALFESAHVKKDGTIMPVEINARIIDFQGRKVFFSVIRDITERKRAEQEIQLRNRELLTLNRVILESTRLLDTKTILQTALDEALAITGVEGGTVCVVTPENTLALAAERNISDAMRLAMTANAVKVGEGLCGPCVLEQKPLILNTRDDVLRFSSREALRGEDIRFHAAFPIIVKGSSQGVLCVFTYTDKKPTERSLKLLETVVSQISLTLENATLYENLQGNIVDLKKEITERKRVEEERERLIKDLRVAVDALTRSKREWQDTFDTITDLIYVIDSDFRILRVNKAFAAYCGQEPRQLIGRRCREVLHENGAVPTACPHAESMRTNGLVQREMADFRKDRIFLVTAFPFTSAKGGGVASIIIARDVTKEREKETRLLMSDRLAALGQMASGVAHEINNPLAAVLGCAEGLLTRIGKDRYDPGFFSEYLGIIKEEVGRCRTITTDMLSFVRTTSYEPRLLDIGDVLRKTLEIVGIQGRMGNMEVTERYEENMPQVFGSAGELRQVFLALITNALDAMNEQGGITIETWSGSGNAFVRISDTGPGIAPENQSRIFAPFFTTKSETGGTGLGLSIVHKIVSNHHGDISVASEPGKGTSFTITLPLSDPERDAVKERT